MTETYNTSDAALQEMLGARLAAWRLARNLTQEELAAQAGLGLRTVQRLESGAAATHLSGFLRVCRVLGLLDQLDVLVPQPPPSPMTQLKSQRPGRQRATRAKGSPGVPKRWTWDDKR